MIEFLFWAALVYLCCLAIVFGMRLWVKEARIREGTRALSKRMQADAKILADEAEAWIKGFFNHKEDK